MIFKEIKYLQPVPPNRKNQLSNTTAWLREGNCMEGFNWIEGRNGRKKDSYYHYSSTTVMKRIRERIPRLGSNDESEDLRYTFL